MESMMKTLLECLKDTNLETVSKAELRKKYLEKTGLTKLSHEDKKLFSSTVNTAYLNYIASKTPKVNEDSDNEIKESNEHGKLLTDSFSDEDITPVNIKESVIANLITNGESDIKMKSSEFEEISLSSTLNGFKNQRGKRTLNSSSEDETSQLQPSKRNKVLEARQNNSLEAQSISEQKKNSESKKKSNSFSESDDSEEESLSTFKKKQLNNPVDSENESIIFSTKNKTKSFNNSKNHSSDSEDEPIIKFKKSNSINSNDKKMEFKTKQKANESHGSLKSINDSSASEDEFLSKKKINSSNKFSKSFESTSGSENESLSKKKVNNFIDSDEEPIIPVTKKSDYMNNSLKSVKDSSDSEDEPLNNFRNKKTVNFNNFKKKPIRKTVRGKVKPSLKKPTANNSKSKEKTSKKKRFLDSDDDSDVQPIATLTKKPNLMNSSLKSVKDLSDSEDEPLNNWNLKKSDHSNSPEKEPAGKMKQTLKKKRFVDSDDDADISNQNKEKSFNGHRNSPLSNSSEDEPLSNIKKERKNSSDSENDVSILNQIKENFIDEQKHPLLSDSSEDEPLLNIKKQSNNFSNSKGNASISNQKKENSINGQKNSLLSDSSEDESLSKKEKDSNNSSDSEDEPLNKLSTKKSDKKQKKSESGSSSFIDENDELSIKKNKVSKRKKTDDSGKERKKNPSASENKIEHLKKYLRVAGIRISNYNKLFENCKTMKAKCEKMMSLLEKEGLKGRPTLEKCKKLRVKIETKREIAELDMSNILKVEGGRPKRSVCSDTTNCKTEKKKSTPVKKFSRLQDIVDSEESD